MSFWILSLGLTGLGLWAGLLLGERFRRHGLRFRAGARPWFVGAAVLVALVVTFLPSGAGSSASGLGSFGVLTAKTVVLAALAAVFLAEERAQLARWALWAVVALGALGLEMVVCHPASRSITRQVMMRDRWWKMRSYPDGDEALRLYLARVGHDVPLERIARRTSRVAMGVTVQSLVAAAEAFGCRGVRLAESDERELIRFGRPCLVALLGDTDRDDRLVLLVAHGSEGWRIADPRRGEELLSDEIFRERWRGRAIYLLPPAKGGRS